MTLAEQIVDYLNKEVERWDKLSYEGRRSPHTDVLLELLELRNEIKRIISDYMKIEESNKIPEGGC